LKLLYLAPRDFPRRVANRVQTLKMAEAFSRQCDFVLAISALHCTVDELWDQYGITHPFQIEVIGEPRLDPKTVFGMPAMIRSVLRHRPDILYMREESPAWALSFAFRNLVYEMLDYSERRSWLYAGLVRRSRRTFAISEGLIDTAVANGLPRDKISLAPDGVDIAAFDFEQDTVAARKTVGLPLEGKIVLYTGRLSDWKGVDVLVKSARLLPDGTRVVIVGGFEGEPEALQNSVEKEGLDDRIDVLGFVSHARVRHYLKAADVLVLPNKPVSKLSTHHTSPLKLFEYMASKRPIVASDLPSIREVVDDTTAIFVAAGDPQDLARGIRLALDGGTAVTNMVGDARKRVGGFTWDQRAKTILGAVG